MNPIFFYESGKRRVPLIGPPISTAIGTSYTGTGKWRDCTTAHNGIIYAGPNGGSQKQVLKIDTTTNTTSLIGPIQAAVSWTYGILAPNGMLYFLPLSGYQMLKVDPTTDTVTLIGSAFATSSITGVLALNGKIYYHNATSIVEFDPTTETNTPVYTISESYLPGVLSPAGHIYYLPTTALGTGKMLRFNPNTYTGDQVGTVPVGTSLYYNGTCAPNGSIYYPPYAAETVLKYNILTETASTIGSVYSGAGKWIGSYLAPNGKIYCNSWIYTINQMLIIDTATDTTSLFTPASTTSKGYGMASIAPSGNLYFPPHATSFTMVLSNVNNPDVLGADAIMPSDLANLATSNYNRYFNKS